MTIFGRISSLLSYLFTLISWLTNRIYYKEIIVVNEGRLPRDTPFILYANHSNQLDDGGVLIGNLNHRLRNVSSAKQMRLPAVGLLLRAAASIPCERSQDVELVLGRGTIVRVEPGLIVGRQTHFTSFTIGTTIILKESKRIFTVKQNEDSQRRNLHHGSWSSSQLVPCGFHYEQANRFRSKILIQIGQPQQLAPDLVQLYSTNRKESISRLLKQVEEGLRKIVLQFEPYEEVPNLKVILHLSSSSSPNQPPSLQLQKEKALAKQYEKVSKGEDTSGLSLRLTLFRRLVEENGLGYDLVPVPGSAALEAVILFVKYCWWFLLIFPGLVMYGPAAGLVVMLAQAARVRLMRKSSTSQPCFHVVASYRIMLAFIIFPLAYICLSLSLHWLFAESSLTILGQTLRVGWFSFLLFVVQPFYGMFFVKCLDEFNVCRTRIRHLYVRKCNPAVYQSYLRERAELETISERMAQK